MDRIWDKYPERNDPVVMAKLLERITPLFEKDDKIMTMVPVDPFTHSFMWDPKPMKEFTEYNGTVDIITYHTFGYHGLFKPTMSECIAKIPEEILDEVVGFAIIEKPETAQDLRENWGLMNEGYHVAKTRLYLNR